jgi:hypothetical protein
MNTVAPAIQPTDEPVDPSTDEGLGLRRIAKSRRLTGEDAAKFAAQVVLAYSTKSIRTISRETGRSYGAIHRVLKNSGITMRSRGFKHEAPASAADTS